MTFTVADVNLAVPKQGTPDRSRLNSILKSLAAERVETLADLKAKENVNADSYFWLLGKEELFDGAEGTFRALSGSAAANGLTANDATVIEADDARTTFVRVIDGNPVQLDWWVPDKMGTADMSSKIRQALTEAYRLGKHGVEVSPGVYQVNDNILHDCSNVVLRGRGAETLHTAGVATFNATDLTVFQAGPDMSAKAMLTLGGPDRAANGTRCFGTRVRGIVFDAQSAHTAIERVSSYAADIVDVFIFEPMSIGVDTKCSPSYTISGVTDAGGGSVTVTTTTAHGFSVGEDVFIRDTTSYNGGREVLAVPTATTFTVAATWGSSETGAVSYLGDNRATQHFHDRNLTVRMRSNAGVCIKFGNLSLQQNDGNPSLGKQSQVIVQIGDGGVGWQFANADNLDIYQGRVSFAGSSTAHYIEFLGSDDAAQLPATEIRLHYFSANAGGKIVHYEDGTYTTPATDNFISIDRANGTPIPEDENGNEPANIKVEYFKNSVRVLKAASEFVGSSSRFVSPSSSNVGMFVRLVHDSASPAANDENRFEFAFNNLSGTEVLGGFIGAQLLDATAGSEDMGLRVVVRRSGSNLTKMGFRDGVWIGANGADRGLDSLDVGGPVYASPGSSVTPFINGHVTFELTNDTTLTFKAKGSDGVVRSGTVSLS